MSSQTIATIAAAVLLLIAVLAAVGTVMTFRKSRRSRAWPTVTGKITHSEVTEDIERELEKDDDDENRVRERITTMYGVKLAYDYVVAGVAHAGTRLYWSDGIKASAPGNARKIVAKYPVGQEVTVYYQPDDPATALLEPGAIKGAVMSGVFAVAFGAFGIVFLMVALKGA